MKLVIVESASKTKSIQKYLGPDYKVVASLGHIMNLPPKALGLDTTTWELTYEPIPTKLKTLKQLKAYAKEAYEVYLASDPDREGEAIAYHLAQALKLTKPKRILFHEITKKAVLEAMQSPGTIDTALVAAQQSRQALDRLVGWKVSPLLWKRFTAKGLSAGRVQSVALKAIVERFQDYESHQAEKFWNLEGTFHIKEKELETTLYSNKGTKLTYESLEDATKILTFLQKKKLKWQVQVEQNKSFRNPSPPYTTSALQQDVYQTFHIPAKETMKIAQALYEAGHITYMRTDSTNLSQEAKTHIQTYLEQHYPHHHQERSFKSKVANAQEAHEAIRPTRFDTEPQSLTPPQKKIYDLIWRRTVASQMVPAEYCDFTFTLTAPTFKDYAFIGKLSYVNKLGYLKVWKPNQKEECTHWQAGETPTPVPLRFTAKGNITKPEGLYNEGSLIKWMEKEGIGRPSTYASIVDKLFERTYIEKGANPLRSETLTHTTLDASTNQLSHSEEVINRGGTETDRFLPTPLGTQVAHYIQSVFPQMMDYTFTSHLEEQLDQVSRKELEKNNLLTRFYNELEPALAAADKERKAHAKEEKAKAKAEAEASGLPSPPKKEKQPAQDKVLLSFPSNGMDLIKTRYGPALFHKDTKTFISVTPFLLWREKELLDLTPQDVTFLQSLPITIAPGVTVEYGRYGLYLKKEGANIRLAKEHWNPIYHGTYNKDALANAPPPPSGKKTFSGRWKKKP
jgi:DNA topoisomerase I